MSLYVFFLAGLREQKLKFDTNLPETEGVFLVKIVYTMTNVNISYFPP